MAELQTAKHTEEAGHWYKKDGSPAYTIIGKTGERPTTLRDARKLGLLPSVTSIIQLAARPGLQAWMNDQLIMACLTMPRIEGESEADYITRLKADSKAQAQKAADRGTLIHARVQDGFEKGSDDPFYLSAFETLLRECGGGKWKTEESFATDRYGGKIDLLADEFVIDIKTTDKDLKTIKTWDEHAMQLSAYRRLGSHRCGILYIHVNTAESKLLWISEDDLVKGLKCFNALLDFYYAKTGL